VPFALIALVDTSATAYVALLVTSRAFRSRVEAQIFSAKAPRQVQLTARLGF
jgi:hypothetical protein